MYPFQASSQNDKLLTDRLDAGRGWATTTPSPPEEGSILRRRVSEGVEAVKKRTGNMLLGSSKSKSMYSPRSMRWRSFAGTAGGVVGGVVGTGIIRVIMAVSVSTGISSITAGIAGSCRAWTVASTRSGGQSRGWRGVPALDGREILSSSMRSTTWVGGAGGAAEPEPGCSMERSEVCRHDTRPSRLLSTRDFTVCSSWGRGLGTTSALASLVSTVSL